MQLHFSARLSCPWRPPRPHATLNIAAATQVTGTARGPAWNIATLSARIAATEGQWDEASSGLRTVLQARRALTGTRPSKVADLLEALGRIAIAQGHYADAEAILVEAQSILVALHSPGDVATTSVSLACADLADARRNVSQAAHLAGQAGTPPRSQHSSPTPKPWSPWLKARRIRPNGRSRPSPAWTI